MATLRKRLYLWIGNSIENMKKCLNCGNEISAGSRAKYCSDRCKLEAFRVRQSANLVKVEITFKKDEVDGFRKNERYMTHQQIVDALFDMYKWRGNKSVEITKTVHEEPKKELPEPPKSQIYSFGSHESQASNNEFNQPLSHQQKLILVGKYKALTEGFCADEEWDNWRATVNKDDRLDTKYKQMVFSR